MPSAIFDGPNKTVTIPTTGEFLVGRDLYSAWKVWVRQGDNAKFLPAFSTTGGDSIGDSQEIAPYFFFRNDLGWIILPPANAVGEITLTGNLFPRDEDLPSFDRSTAINVLIRQIVSPQALVDGSQILALELLTKLLNNKMITDPVTGVQTVFDDDGTTILKRHQLYEDVNAVQTYRGSGAERRDPLP